MTTLVERHVIRKGDARWSEIDHAAWLAKNLWNASNYILRQTFIFDHTFLAFKELYRQVRDVYPQDYDALPRKVSNQVLRQVYGAWQYWFKALKAYEKAPEHFTGRPKMPGYKHKEKGRNRLVYDIQAFSKKKLRDGIVAPSGLNATVQTQVAPERVKEVHITPQTGCYVVQVIYSVEPAERIGGDYAAGVDIGLDNLAAIATNKPGIVPILVNGRPLKSINQFYNKRKSDLQSRLPANQKSSRQIRSLTYKRNVRVDDYLHRASRLIVDWLVEHRIGTLVIGKNNGWKQRIAIGKRNNQQFVGIPHARFVHMLAYKAELAGIEVIFTEESYTSKCSLLDMEPIEKHAQYVGRRVKRGLFRASNGTHINADINAAGNIIRKAIPNAFADGIGALAVAPVRVHRA
jgi:putative transposase